MKKRTFIYMVLALFTTLLTMSCNSDENTINEFDNWESKSSAFFSTTFANAKAQIEKGNTSWKVLRKWSLPQESTTFSPANDDHIVAQVLSSGTSTDRAFTTDSVLVSYKARIIPSTNYPQGKVYLKTFEGEYNANTNAPVTIPVTGNMRIWGDKQVSVTDGLSTALQNMHVGDRWLVYIPAKLGYSESESTMLNIPLGSTLVVDLTLVGVKK